MEAVSYEKVMEKFRRDRKSSFEGVMPEISRFFGIIIRMFVEFAEPHHIPHFHVFYQDESAVYSIDPIDMISGGLPKRQQRLVEAWAELHQAELMADWEMLYSGRPAMPIEPLK